MPATSRPLLQLPGRLDLPGGRSALLAPLDPQSAIALGTAFSAMSPWVDYPYSPKTLIGYLGQEESQAPRIAIRVDGRIAGVMGLRLRWLLGPYIQFLGILPEAQGHGVGGAALSWLEREMRQSEQRNIWVAASDFNAGAQRFYARHGFKEAATLDDLVCEGRAEVLLRKRLA